MARLRSMRTWFAATIVGVSVLTAGAIALYVVPSTDGQYRALAQDAALGLTARAAHDVGNARSAAEIHRALARASRDGQLSLWLVGSGGHVISASALPSVSLRNLPDADRAIAVSLAGRRFVPAGDATASHVVALPSQTEVGRSRRARRLRAAHGIRRARERRAASALRARNAARHGARRRGQPRRRQPGLHDGCGGSRRRPRRSPAATSLTP